MRTEYKYLIPETMVPEVRRRIMPFVRPDANASGQSVPSYTVRSIYFDTARLRYYHEKQAGLYKRQKLRIRAYDALADDSCVFLEIKRKEDMAVAKDRAPVRFDEVHRILHDADLDDFVQRRSPAHGDYESARNFYFHLHRHRLSPVLLVVYDREPYVGRIDPGLRITFDKALRSHAHPSLDELYREDGLLPCMPGFVIMEVKFNGSFPFWLRPILIVFQLQRQALSKYVRCADTHGLVRAEGDARLLERKRPTPSTHIARL